MQGKIGSRNNEMAVWKFSIVLPPSLPTRKKSFPVFTVFWVLKTQYHALIFFWQAAMFSYTSIIWLKDGISVLLLLCLWVKCTQSRCQREKAPKWTLGGGRGAREVDTCGGTKCIPPTSYLLTPVLQPTRWATLFTGSCFCARISLVDNQFLMPFAQTVRVNELTSFCHFFNRKW